MDFIELLEKTNLHMVYIRSYCSRSDIEKIKKYDNIIRHYKNRTAEEIAIKSSVLIGKYSDNLLKYEVCREMDYD